MIYGYISVLYNSPDIVRMHLKEYAQTHNIHIDDIILDPESNKVDWRKRLLLQLLNETLQPGDTLIVYEPSNLARSTAQIIDILRLISEQGLTLHIAKYKRIYPQHNESMDTESFLKLIQSIEGDFVAKRVTDAMARRRAQGLPIGRPKGRQNKSLKLDKHRDEIQKYLDLRVSRASIAKLIGCNAQTLYNYIAKRGLKPRTKSKTQEDS